MRARLALAEARVRVELREVVLRNKPAEMLAVSPKGTVPVLALSDGSVIEESLEIMEWAADQGGRWASGGVAEGLVRRNDTFFKTNLDRYKYASRYDVDPLEHRALALEFVSELNDLLKAAAYLSGPAFDFADAAIAPFVRQFAGADLKWFATLDYPELQSWLAAFVESSRFKDVMGKYPAWASGDSSLVWPQ